MTLFRFALETALGDGRFVEKEVLPSLPLEAAPIGRPINPRILQVEDREEVSAEVATRHGGRLFLDAFGKDGEAEHAFLVMEALWEAGFGEGSRYRVPRPLAYLPDFRLVVMDRSPGISVAALVDRRAPEAVGAIRDAGSWLARLHSSDAWVGSPSLPWRSLMELAEWVRRLRLTTSPYHAEVRRLLRRLSRLASEASIGRMVQTHGRFRPDRVFASPGLVSVDDFVRSAPGDPVRDVAEFLFHLRLRGARSADHRTEVLASIFLDAYLVGVTDAQLGTLPFYGACAALTSLARLLVCGDPRDDGFEQSVDFHLLEFDDQVAGQRLTLKAPA